MTELREKIGEAMRTAFNEFEGGSPHIIPWHVANSRPAWLACADAALKILAEEEEAKARARH
jgi:hypothetical protein